MINRSDMTAAACNQWSGLFNVGEEFDDEDLLEADWSCASESTSASTSESLKVSTTNVQKNIASSSSIPAGSTPGSLRGPVKTLSSLSIPVHHSLSSSIPSLRAPASSLQPPTGQKNPPSTASRSVLQSELPQDDFDDWDVDLDELDESIPQMVSQPQKNLASDRISPAKRMRPSSSSGAQVSSHISFCSTTSMSAVARPSVNISSTLQVPTHLSTPIHIRSHMRGPVIPVSQFPRPLSPKPPVVLSQRWSGPSTPRTPLQPRGSLFHSVSSTPNPSPTLTPRPLSTPVMTNHLVQLVSAANKTPQRPQSSVMRSKARRFPGPAGALPQQVSGRSLDDIVVSVPQTPAHGAVARSRSEGSSSQGSEEEEFSRGPWAVMKAEMGLDEKNPSCFLHSYSVVMVLRKAALRQLAKNKVPNMAVVLKSITHTHADAKAIFRDHTGEMQGTVHRRLVEDRQGDLKTGAVLLLKQVGVFSPSHRNHYLNVTPNNLLKIYPPDGVLHNSQISLPPLELVSQCEPENTAGGPVSRMELHFDDDDEEEGENTVELKRAAAGSDHTAAVSNEVCQAPTGSGLTEDTAWETDDLDELLGELPVESYGGEL